MKFDLRAFIQEKNYIDKNEPVVIALSGGVDSMVLFIDYLYLNING